MKKYDKSFDYADGFREFWNGKVKGVRIVGFILAAVLAVLGFVLFFKPMQTVYVIGMIAAIIMIATGIYEIIDHFTVPVWLRTGGLLLAGIVNILMGILLLKFEQDELFKFFAFIVGIDMLIVGLEKLGLLTRLRYFGVEGTGWLIFTGILNILAAFCLFFLPVESAGVLSAVIGIYLIVCAVTLLIDCIQARSFNIPKQKPVIYPQNDDTDSNDDNNADDK